MILVLASPEDLLARETAACLKQRGHETLVVPEAQLHSALQIRWVLPAPIETGYLAQAKSVWPLQHVSGVLVRTRRAFHANLAEGDDPNYIQAEWAALLHGFLNAIPCPVVNRPRPGAGQLPPESSWVAKALLRSGLHAPRTLVTASAATAADFFKRNGRRVICSSPGGGCGVLLEGDPGRHALQEASVRPVRLQAVPDGRWQRVLVIGREALSEGLPALPEPLAAPFVSMAASLELQFMELLCLSARDGSQIIFSINEFPDLATCGPSSQLRIIEALANLLAGKSQRKTISKFRNGRATRPPSRSSGQRRTRTPERAVP